ncbi:hypothetical protein GCM10010245_88830 [Streptomyces spectabilis]|nr:hypothetical protein GCM10010245_88830 [Streptomyces spectabilis]
MAEAGLLQAGPADAPASTEERDASAGRSWVRGIGGDRLALRGRDPRGPGFHFAGHARSPHRLGEGDFVIVDGTLIPIDRIRADEPYSSQKHKKHGMNVQVIAHPDGTSLWFSAPCPDGPTT